MSSNTPPGPDEPRGESALLLAGALEIRSRSVGPMDNNAYLLTCRSSGAQLLIDAAAEVERLQAMIAEGSPTGRLDLIVTTHRHHDHVGALAELVAATGARTAAGTDDAAAIEVPTDLPLSHGDVVELGDQHLEVIALRGHTPGSIALLWHDENRGPEAGHHLFTGDSLFPGGVGNTDRDPLRFHQLLADVEERVFDRLPDATAVHPGHGAGTTLGAERPSLPQWRERGW